jgi:hypothetical protein
MQVLLGRRALVDVAVAMAAFLVSGTWLLTATGAGAPHFLAAIGAGLAVVGNAAASVFNRKPRLTTAADRVTLIRAVLVLCGGNGSAVVQRKRTRHARGRAGCGGFSS